MKGEGKQVLTTLYQSLYGQAPIIITYFMLYTPFIDLSHLIG